MALGYEYFMKQILVVNVYFETFKSVNSENLKGCSQMMEVYHDCLFGG